MTTQPSKQSHADASDEIDLGKLFGILLDAKWWIIVTTFIFALGGVSVALLSTPIYKADALVQIEAKNSGGISSMVGDMGELFSQESSATTEVEILKSRMILGETVDKFNLTTVVTPKFTPIFGKGLSRLLGIEPQLLISRFITPAGEDVNGYSIKVVDNLAGVYQLLDKNDKVILDGKVGELSKAFGFEVFVVRLSSEDNFEFLISKRTQLQAIEWLKASLSIQELGKQTGILRLSFEGESKESIKDYLNSITQTYFLQNVERNSAEAQNSLSFLESHLPDIKAKLTNFEDTLNNYRKENESIDLGLEAQSALRVLVELEAQLNELTFKESEISQRFTKDHPAYKSLLDKRQTLINEKDRLNSQIQKLPETQREILRMTRDVEVNQQIYIQLLNKVQELNIIKAGTVGNIRILDDAQTHSAAIKPKKAIIVILATILGAGISAIFILLKAILHKGIENPEEIEKLGLPVYATVPKSELQMELSDRVQSKKSDKTKSTTLLAESNPADLSIEALRGLRTSLHFAMLEAKNNVLMISGPAPGIGKSFVSTNFAAVAAKTGQKVLLIDADMRKGYLQQSFALKWDEGLSDILSGKSAVEDVVKTTSIDNLDIITRGQIPPNPSELLTNERLGKLIEIASSKYDLVIVDTPPVLAVTDPSIIGSFSGTTLMVARYGESTAKEVEIAANRFRQAGVEVKGVIFNAMESKASNNYGYYSYTYN
tara:strand:- start:14247 stop:16400 length:2154 start_codon:yes stop_codon:yes gene_type:complete